MAKAKDFNEEMIKIRKEIVDFHGEMVLLENYSALNYTGNFTFLYFTCIFNVKGKWLIFFFFWLKKKIN